MSVGDEIVPNEFNLSQNYPNPFNPTTVINFSLPKESKIKIVLFDVMGRKISVLADGSFIAGNHSLKIDGSNLTAGTYFYQLVTGSQTLTKKMLLVK